MHLYVYYLKQTYPEDAVQTLLSHVLNIEKSAIGGLTMPGDFKIRYEHRHLDQAEFSSELSIFWENDLELHIGRKAQLASKISRYIQNEVVVKYKEDDPHQWILVDKDQFFVAQEILGNNIGINLLRENMTVLEQ